MPLVQSCELFREMQMSDATKLKKQSSVRDVAEEARRIAVRNSAKQEQSEQKNEEFAEIISTNTFAKIMLSPDIMPEAKRDALVQALTFSKDSTKEENREKLRQFSQFKEYLQEQRKILNREGIKLQDTKAFAELQSVIDDMTKSSIEFQEKVKPLIDVLNAVFEIRKHDKITDVYKEIQNDKLWLEEQTKELKNLENELTVTQQNLLSLSKEKARLLEDRNFFGFGSVKHSARERISEIENVEQKRLEQSVSLIIQKISQQKNIIDAGPDSESSELKEQKAVLKEFLDLTKEENTDRQKSLIQAGVNYVDTSDQRLKSVLETLDRLGSHAEVVSDANSMLRNMHLIMDESLKEVSKYNGDTKKALATAEDSESPIARMTREERLKDLNEYITLTDDSAIDVANSIGGLTKHSVQIQAYKDTLRNESGSTKRLHLEGVSQMGEQLMSVISAISAAATSESRALAANNFAKMAEQNQTIISQEVVRNASNIEVEANSIAKLVGELEDYGQVLSASSEIASQGYGRMRETVDAIRKISGSVQNSINDLIEDRADAGIAAGAGQETEMSKSNAKSQEFANPFDKLKS